MFLLIYDPQRLRFPTAVRLNREDLRFVPVLCCGLGLICLFVGVAVWLFNIRAGSRNAKNPRITA